jgi:hypothetical protein
MSGTKLAELTQMMLIAILIRDNERRSALNG